MCVCTANTSPRKVRSKYNKYHSVLVCFKLECSVEGFLASAQSTYIIQVVFFFFLSFHPTSQSLAPSATCSPDCSEHHGAGSLSQLTEVPLPQVWFSPASERGAPPTFFPKTSSSRRPQILPASSPQDRRAQLLPLMCLCQPPPPPHPTLHGTTIQHLVLPPALLREAGKVPPFSPDF